MAAVSLVNSTNHLKGLDSKFSGASLAWEGELRGACPEDLPDAATPEAATDTIEAGSSVITSPTEVGEDYDAPDCQY